VKVNLLPYQMAQKAGPNWRTIFTLAGVVMLAAVTLIFYVALQARVASYAAKITAAEEQYKQYTEALDRKTLLDQLQAAYTSKSCFINQLAGQGVKWNDIMDELRDIIPRTVVLDAVTADTNGVITLQGRAGSLQAMAQFMINIQTGRTIEKPDIISADWNPDAGAFMFTMTCRAKQQQQQQQQQQAVTNGG